MENEFYDVMNVLTDHELLQKYLNKSDYTSEAVLAMEFVLKERKLEIKAETLENTKQKFDSRSKEEIYNQFQLAEFGRIISDSDYAKEQRLNSTYFQKNISPLHNYGWVFTLFIILGIIGLAFAGIIIGIGEYIVPFNYMLVISIGLAVLLPLGIWKMSKNKSQVSIVNEGRHDFLIINGAKEYFKIQFPLRYECYWKWEHIKLHIKQLKLVIYIYDDKGNTVFELGELQVLTKSPPPHFEKFPSDIPGKFKDKDHLVYTSYGTQKQFLLELQKIISGLQ